MVVLVLLLLLLVSAWIAGTATLTGEFFRDLHVDENLVEIVKLYRTVDLGKKILIVIGIIILLIVAGPWRFAKAVLSLF